MMRKLEARHIEVMDEQMAAIYRAMPTRQKGLIVAQAHDTMRALLEGRLLTDHPGWSREQINAEIGRRLLGDAAIGLKSRIRT